MTAAPGPPLPSPNEPAGAGAVGGRFLHHFVLPLVRGGDVRVGAPLGQRGLLRLRSAVDDGLDDTAAGQLLSAERQALAAEVLLHPPAPRLADDPGALAVLVAWHDLLFLLHPDAERLVLGGRRRGRVLHHALRLCEQAAVPRTLSNEDLTRLLVERHTLLHALWTLSRTDVRISFWAGRRKFIGQEPPARLLAWRSVRRVQEERWHVVWYLQMLGMPGGGQSAVVGLLSASPLTDLMQPRRLNPPLDLRRHAGLLRLPEIARAVAYHYLSLGLGEIGGALGAALLSMLANGEGRPAFPDEGGAPAEPPLLDARRADARTVLRFMSHLHLCALLAPAAGAEAGDGPAALAGGAGPGKDAPLRDFYGIFGALCAHWPSLARPADLLRSRDDETLARIDAHAQACRQAVGQARLDQLLGLCARALSAGASAAPAPSRPGPDTLPAT